MGSDCRVSHDGAHLEQRVEGLAQGPNRADYQSWCLNPILPISSPEPSPLEQPTTPPKQSPVVCMPVISKAVITIYTTIAHSLCSSFYINTACKCPIGAPSILSSFFILILCIIHWILQHLQNNCSNISILFLLLASVGFVGCQQLKPKHHEHAVKRAHALACCNASLDVYSSIFLHVLFSYSILFLFAFSLLHFILYSFILLGFFISFLLFLIPYIFFVIGRKLISKEEIMITKTK